MSTLVLNFVFIVSVEACSSDGVCDKHERLEHNCETLMMCMITVFKDGVKAGGGIGDVIRKPSSKVSGMGMVRPTNNALFIFSY